MQFNGHKFTDKIRIVEKYSSLEICIKIQKSTTCTSQMVHLPAEVSLWIRHRTSGSKWLNQCTFPFGCVPCFFSTYNSKPNYGHGYIKNSRWNFQAMSKVIYWAINMYSVLTELFHPHSHNVSNLFSPLSQKGLVITGTTSINCQQILFSAFCVLKLDFRDERVVIG